MAAVTKSNIRRFINEKNDCVTSSDFVKAAKSTGYMTLMACRVPNSSVTNNTKWQGIRNFNNIQYELVLNKANHRSKREEKEINITVWRAFGIGAGQTFQLSKLNVSDNIIAPIETSVRHDNFEWQDDSFARGVDICRFLDL
jgi:hypothetical protein